MLSIALCLAELPKLRNEISLRPIQVIELLGDVLGYTLPGSESDYLNELAQSLAEHHGNAISFIDNYPKSKYTAPVLTFGFKLRGDVTFKTILLNDSTEIVDHMNGFLDFRARNSKINMQATEIRDMIKAGECPLQRDYHPRDCTWTRSTGSVTGVNGNWKKTVTVKNVRDILPIALMYDDFIDSQIKLMDSNGNLPLGWNPVTFNMDFKNFHLKIESTDSYPFPLRVDPSLPRNHVKELIDNHYRLLIENTTLEDCMVVAKSINTYGFGIALDGATNEITIVYSLGSSGSRPTKNTNYRARLTDYTYTTSKGVKLDFNPFNFQTTLADMNWKSVQFMLGLTNMNRFKIGFGPISASVPSLHALATKEAERMLSFGISEPNLSSTKGNTVLIAYKFAGATTVREFLYNVNDNYIGSAACFDNFSNQRGKVYTYGELPWAICNKVARDAYGRLEAYGGGLAYNSDGDMVAAVVLSDYDY